MKFAMFFIMGVLAASCGSHSDKLAKLDGKDASSSADAILTMEDWTSAADHIIIAARAGEARYVNGSLQYTLEVEQELKGTLSGTTIDVYALQGLTENYKRHVLFLHANDSEYYDEATYSVIHSDNALDGGLFQSGPFKGMKENQLLKDISRSPGVRKINIKPAIVEQPENMATLIANSDYILHLVPRELRFENNVIREYTVDLVHVYKGDERINAKESLILPNEVEDGDNYLVFYRLRDQSDISANPSITLTTRSGSVIPGSDEQSWAAAIASLRGQ